MVEAVMPGAEAGPGGGTTADWVNRLYTLYRQPAQHYGEILHIFTHLQFSTQPLNAS